MEILWLVLTGLLPRRGRASGPSGHVERAAKQQRRCSQPEINLLRTRDEPATKSSPTAASMGDDSGRWTTVDDNDNRANRPGAACEGKKSMQAHPRSPPRVVSSSTFTYNPQI